MVYGRYNYGIHGDYFRVYKPTNITGGPHPIYTDWPPDLFQGGSGPLSGHLGYRPWVVSWHWPSSIVVHVPWDIAGTLYQTDGFISHLYINITLKPEYLTYDEIFMEYFYKMNMDNFMGIWWKFMEYSHDWCESPSNIRRNMVISHLRYHLPSSLALDDLV